VPFKRESEGAGVKKPFSLLLKKNCPALGALGQPWKGIYTTVFGKVAP
jgi:hypothetical protein